MVFVMVVRKLPAGDVNCDYWSKGKNSNSQRETK